MSRTTARRCELCHEPIVWVDHGRPYPAAGVMVLCMDPVKVRCPCGAVSTFARDPSVA